MVLSHYCDTPPPPPPKKKKTQKTPTNKQQQNLQQNKTNVKKKKTPTNKQTQTNLEDQLYRRSVCAVLFCISSSWFKPFVIIMQGQQCKQWNLLSYTGPSVQTVEPVVIYRPISANSGTCCHIQAHQCKQWNLLSYSGPSVQTVDRMVREKKEIKTYVVFKPFSVWRKYRCQMPASTVIAIIFLITRVLMLT